MFTAKNTERGEKVLCSVFKLLKGQKYVLYLNC